MSSEDCSLLRSSRLFDERFYLHRNPDVAAAGVDPVEHYLAFGATERRRPSVWFDGDWYLRHNEDVLAARMNPLVHYLRYGQHEGRRRQKRGVVYTAIAGNYDELKAPQVSDPDLDYIAFTDDWITDAPEPWLRLPLPWVATNPRLASRYVKVFAHRLLRDYEVSAWVDAAFQLKSFHETDIENLLGSHVIAFFAHPDRNCAYLEAEVVRQLELDQPDAIERVVHRLRAENTPAGAGLVATGVVLRQHADPMLAAAMEDWWEHIEAGSVRDQLSINHVLSKHGIAHATIPGSIWSNAWMDWIAHRPPPWRGLQCGGAYLDAEEYEAIERLVHEHDIRTAVEIGAGETSILFSMLGVQTTSIECSNGPWIQRAMDHGCHVAVVPYDEAAARFSPTDLEPILRSQGDADLLFIDSPVGTHRRAGIVGQILEVLSVRFVLYHDAWRDAANILRDQRQSGLEMVDILETPRGLALFRVDKSRGKARADGGASTGSR